MVSRKGPKEGPDNETTSGMDLDVVEPMLEPRS